MQPVPERTAAKVAGERFYDTGKPCKNGHVAKRYTAIGICIVCAAQKVARWKVVHPGEEARWARERRAKDPTGHRAEVGRWATKNPQKVREIVRRANANYRARKFAAPGVLTREDIDAIRKAQRGRCALCAKKTKRLEADHIVPLTRGGSNEPRNFQLLCRSCNARKNDSDPLDYSRTIGRLL